MSRFTDLFQQLQSGGISRRDFLQASLAGGMALPVALHAVAVTGQTPVPAADRPMVGVEGKERGSAGELRLIQWQAPTLLATHSAQGGKDNLAAALIMEPLTNYLADGTVVPNLVSRIPSVENGLLAEDATSVTYELLPDVVWSDGEPFTAEDVKFTWEWVTNRENGATSFETYDTIQNVVVVDDHTVTFEFSGPQPAWYVPFAGTWWGSIYPRHILENGNYDEFMMNPVGTGPYVLESFAPNDQVVYVMNENYRDRAKPYFERVLLKGGGDASSAARSVLQSGEYDLAWNLQVEPEVLQSMEEAGLGTVAVYPGSSLEHINLQLADPHTEVDGEQSSLAKPNPTLADAEVRRALAAAIDRDLIATTFYGEGEPAATNVLVGLPAMESSREPFTFNSDEAAAILEAAGWMLDGDVRKKDGVELSLTYNTTVNSVRQKTQAVVKSNLESIGVKVELKQTDAGIYFDSSAGNTQSYIHFYDDMGMSTANIDSPFPLSYMNRWYAGPDNANVPQKANDWGGQNLCRYVNPDYDATFEQAAVEVDPVASAELFIALNDFVIDDNVVIPLVQRAAEKLAVSNRLVLDNIAAGPFETIYWNIQNWTTSE